jgi:hypothetical protein
MSPLAWPPGCLAAWLWLPGRQRSGAETLFLKGHGNEADFLGFLQKPVRHRFLTLHFEPFRFGLRNRGDIHNRKTTPRLA